MPKKEDIRLSDIAHSLSLVCRANGHIRHFYSVAQHCIACAREAEKRGLSDRVVLGCLLHDASEAYLSDVTRPIKKELTDYLRYEAALQDMIWSAFMGSPPTREEAEEIFAIDDAMLDAEFHLLMPEDIGDRWKDLRLPLCVDEQRPEAVRKCFMEMGEELIGRIFGIS